MERDGADGSMRPERLAGRPWSCGCGVCARPSSAWRDGIFMQALRQFRHCGNKMRVARGSACRWAMLRSWVACLGLGEGASVVCAAPSVEPVRCFDAAHRLRGHPARTYITDAHHFLRAAGHSELRSGEGSVGIGCRRFIVDDEGRLVWLRNAIFERRLRDPQHHTMLALAGQRVRMAEIPVQLANRRPIHVVRRGYFVVSSDEARRLDTMRLQDQQWALAASAPEGVFAVPSDDNRLLDVALRFIAQGGRWRPSVALAQHIDDAALGCE